MGQGKVPSTKPLLAPRLGAGGGGGIYFLFTPFYSQNHSKSPKLGSERQGAHHRLGQGVDGGRVSEEDVPLSHVPPALVALVALV